MIYEGLILIEQDLKEMIDLEHDKMDIANFNPERINMVCRLQNEQLKEFNTWKNRYNESFKRIDSTFEIQVRTTLSEGWHEIEHNMRYKCKKITLFNFDKELAKAFYKIERSLILHELIKHDLRMDISFNNIIYLCNYLFVKNELIRQITPPALMLRFEETFKQDS
ncbi:MAG: hypothetical protein ACK5N4_04745 [Parabacteroides gordonii]|uniref:hypothetical protein n=1 Tax=Parabacteroides gordonii TaxID=574930 RepID=UPI003A846DB7